MLKGDCLLGLCAAAAAVALGDVGSRSSESERQGSVDTSDIVCLACGEAEVLLERVRMMSPPPGVVASLVAGGRSCLPAAMLGRESSVLGSQAAPAQSMLPLRLQLSEVGQRRTHNDRKPCEVSRPLSGLQGEGAGNTSCTACDNASS